MKVTIPYNFEPRVYQRNLYNCIANGYKRGVAIWHRRAGKDKTLINILAKEACKRVGSYYYFFPTYAQGRKILWDGMDRDGFPFLGHIPPEIRAGKPNSTEMKQKLVNGSLIQVVGSDNIDTIVGTNPVGCVFSEYALQDPNGYDFVRPILRENGGWALFNFTPRGYNHGHDLYDMALTNPDWFCELLTVLDTKKPDDTPVISLEDIEAERADGMAEDLIQQEYFCSFEASIPGAYFADEMRIAKQTGKVCDVPVDPNLDVFSWWDIGIDDSMTVWLSQDSGPSIYMIAYYEKSGEPFAHFVNWLKDFRDQYKVRFEKHTLPHDGENRNPQTGKSSVDFLRQLLDERGLSGAVGCAPKPPQKADGIEASRQIIPKCLFDKTRCKDGINALTQFRKDWNQKKQLYVHVHDWASHGADGFQTMALGHRFRSLTVPFRPKRTPVTKSSAWRPKRGIYRRRY